MVQFIFGLFIGLFIAALMRANDPPCVETCPKCQGVTGYEAGPNDWHDCDLCDAMGKVRSK